VVRHWSASLLVIKKSYLSGLDRPDERPSLPPFPHIRSGDFEDEPAEGGEADAPEKHDRDHSFFFLHDAYDLSR
jgi:hypothetical protein